MCHRKRNNRHGVATIESGELTVICIRNEGLFVNCHK